MQNPPHSALRLVGSKSIPPLRGVRWTAPQRLASDRPSGASSQFDVSEIGMA